MRLLVFLAVLFGVPYLEFMVFAEVSSNIGTLSAILLTFLTAVFGIYIIKREGISVIGSMQENLQEGKSPVTEIFHGFLLLIAGFFFLLPGFITDFIALLFSISFVRDIVSHLLVKNFKVKFDAGNPSSSHNSPYDDGSVIDGEFDDADNEADNFLTLEEKLKKPNKKPSPNLENDDKNPKS